MRGRLDKVRNEEGDEEKKGRKRMRGMLDKGRKKETTRAVGRKKEDEKSAG